MKLSIVTTLYQSAAYVEDFHGRIAESAQQVGDDYEIILVNDGSPDDSLAVAVELHRQDPRVRVVDLSRNFGHHKAMMTGLAHARGERVMLMDCDLEEDPALLERFCDEMDKTDADVIYGVRDHRKGGFVERVSGKIFYGIFNALSNFPLPENLVTARLMTRRYVDALVQHREREILIAGLWEATGFEQIAVTVEKQHKGSSSYNFRRKMVHLVNAITSFSNKPLVYIFYIGTFILCVSSAAAFGLVCYRLFGGVLRGGWASLMVSLWFLGGLIIFALGVIGIYLSKIFSETKQRPFTIIRAVYESDESRGES
jgi:putative glycosyltransferase